MPYAAEACPHRGAPRTLRGQRRHAFSGGRPHDGGVVVITLVSLGRSDAERWDAFVEATKYGTLFHRWRWLDFVERYQHVSVERLAVTCGGQWIAILPLAYQRLGPVTVAGSPLHIHATPYQGPLAADPPDRDVYDAIAAYLRRRRVRFCRINLSDKMDAGAVAAGPRFRKVLRRTHVLDLSPSVAELWNGMDSARRRVIRKAEKAALTIATAEDQRHIGAYHTLEV